MEQILVNSPLKKLKNASSKKLSKQERHAHWQEIIQQQKSSGMTVRNYCQMHEIEFETFRRWQYRLNRLARAMKSADNKINFIPLAAQKEVKAVETVHTPLEIVITSQHIRIVIADQFDTEMLTQIFKAAGVHHAHSH